jgi:ribosomal protein S6--L-glutamate ligase
MGWISFDPFRTLGFADTLTLKPEHFFQARAEIEAAQWVLFPEYWQVNALVYGLKARIFPSQASYLLGHNKIEMSRAFQCVAPQHVPQTHILANTESNADEIWQRMELPFVAKLPRSSQGEGVWLIENRTDWRAYLAKTEILYVQEYLPIDRDIRIVIVGDKVITAYWRLQSSDGFHNNIARGGDIMHGPVPQSALDLALQVAQQLGINHAGFDIAMLGGHPYLLEFNRLFGTQGIPGGSQQLRHSIFDYLSKSSTPPGPNYPYTRPPRLKRVA